MKEDAQLVCPISYDDPDGHWDKLQPYLLDRIPLRDVTWKSPISSSYITIARLPLRFLPSSANLFKDTDHSFRWFLSPYVYVYVLGAETLESYKAVKPSVKKWVDSHNLVKGSLGRSPWMIIYLPLGNYSYESYAKVYSRICSDFYVDKVGDRSVMLMLPNEDSPPVNKFSLNNISSHGNSAMMLLQQSHNSFSDLLTKLRDGIVVSFQHRSALYDSDIRRLDSTRGSPTFDFRQLFLVKESLALLYQMMQLSDMALAQYEELEAILPFAPVNQLPDNDWPLVAPEPFKTGEAEANSPLSKEKEKDLMTDAVKNGDDIVVYSINLARMKILKNKMSLLELHRYVFARQMFFLITLQRPVNCAQKGLEFLKFCSNVVEKKVQTTSQVSIQQHEAGPFSVNLRMKQAEVWTLTSSIKILRVCRDLIKKIFNIENGGSNTATSNSANGSDPTSQSFSMRQSRSSMDTQTNNSNNDPLLAASTMDDQQQQQSMDQTFRASSMLNERMFVLKESFMVLSEIMEFANSKLAKLTPIGRYAKSLSFKIISEFGHSYLQLNEPFFNWFDSSALSQEIIQREQKTIVNATEYFSIFYESDSARTNILKLQKELELVNSNDINLDQMLVSVSQRIRTASHYWAKLYGVERYKTYELDDRHPLDKYIVLSEKANCTRLQVEVGRALEISIYTLMNRSLAEIHAFCDRLRFSNLAKMDVISTLLSTQQHSISSRLLQDLLYGPISTSMSMKKDMIASSINGWPELRMWALLALLLAASKTNDLNSMKQALGWLSIENISCSGRPISDWIEKLIDLVPMISTVAPTSNPEGGLIANSSSCSLNVMPAESFFSISLHLADEQLHSLSRPVKVKGFEMIQEEMFPVSVFQYICEPDGHFLYMKTNCRLTQPFAVDRFALIFKKLQPEIFQAGHQGGVYGYQSLSFQARDESSTAEEERDSFVANLFTPVDDEFVCEIVRDKENGSYDEDGRFVLLPGEQILKLKFSPSVLGEYGLDRIVMSRKSLLLFSKVLTNCSDWSSLPYFVSPSLSGVGSSGLGRRGWGIPSTPMGIAYNSMELEHMPYSQFEIQTYFDKYPLIKIQEPKQLVSISVNTSNISPPYQVDYCSIVLSTLPDDVIEDIVIHVSQKEESKKISREIKSRLSSTAPSTLSIRAVNTPSGQGNGSRQNHQILVGTPSGINHSDSSTSNRWKALDLDLKIAEPEEWTVKAVNKETGGEVDNCEVLYDFYFSTNNVYIGDINGNTSNSNSQQHVHLLQQQLNQQLVGGGIPSSSGHGAVNITSAGAYDPYEESMLREERRLAKCLKLVNIAPNSSVLIRIPFIALPQCDYRKMQDIIFLSGINVAIEGRLRRGGCKIPFQINASNNVSCGLLLTGSALGCTLSPKDSLQNTESEQLRDKVGFVQANLHNLGPEAVFVIGYSFLHGESDRWNILSKVSGNGNSSEESSNRRISILHAPKDLDHFEEVSPETACNICHNHALIKTGEDYYTAFRVGLPGNIGMNTTAIRFYYVRQEDCMAGGSTTDVVGPNMGDAKQLFHFDVLVADNSKGSASPVALSSTPAMSIDQSAIPVGNLLQSKVQYFTTLGAVTKISAVLKPCSSQIHILRHKECKLRMEVVSVGVSSDDTSPYYLNSTIELPDETNILMRASVVSNHEWINLGIKFTGDIVKFNEEGISIDFLVIPLSVGELNIPSIKIEALEVGSQEREVNYILNDQTVHPVALRSNYSVMVTHTKTDLEAVSVAHKKVGKVNTSRQVTHFLCYQEIMFSESSMDFCHDALVNQDQ